jgi:cytochrome c peroxidase
MITGIRSNAEVAVRAGLKYIQFAVRPEADSQAMDAYLKSLRPVPSPYLEHGRLSKAASRGKKVYEKAECITCHSGPYYTDLKLHEIGLAEGLDKGRPLDTPTLVECWRTAPYLHDGRAATMRDVLENFNPDNRHGQTLQLTDDELADLEAYVLSL